MEHYQEELSALIRRGNRLGNSPRAVTNRSLQIWCRRGDLVASLDLPILRRPKAIYLRPSQARRLLKKHLGPGHQEDYYGLGQDHPEPSFVDLWDRYSLLPGPPLRLETYQKSHPGLKFFSFPPPEGTNHASSLFQTSWDFEETASGTPEWEMQ